MPAAHHPGPHCATAFSNVSHLTAHVRTVHEKRRDYACPHCAAAFGHSSCVKRHVRRVHEKREEEDVYAV